MSSAFAQIVSRSETERQLLAQTVTSSCPLVFFTVYDIMKVFSLVLWVLRDFSELQLLFGFL